MSEFFDPENYRTQRMKEALRTTFDFCREADNKRREAELMFEKAVVELTAGIDRIDERAKIFPSVDYGVRHLPLAQLRTTLPDHTQRLAAHAARERRNELAAFEEEHGITPPVQVEADDPAPARYTAPTPKKRGRPPGKRR